ncbi:hypothetical protein BKA62DRAFT_639675, partial [Auriculariales sp. MPI-PUGE-AT-0066]
MNTIARALLGRAPVSHSARRNIALSAFAMQYDSTHDSDAWHWWREQKKSALLASLRDPVATPTRVWSSYIDCFVHGVQRGLLAPDVHREVLRRCVAPLNIVRRGAADRLRFAYGKNDRHRHELRLQRVIRTMRDVGVAPTVQDYNFVIRQFAASGYQSGAWRVFCEMVDRGLEPNMYSYGHCLQAIAHRLDLPCARSTRVNMLEEAKTICDAILHHMDACGFAATSVHIDLCLRIMRSTADEAAFTQLLRQAYGIDLEYPDRLPLSAQDPVLPSLTSSAEPTPPVYHPFSVHVLNTVINFLGGTDNVSRMMLAYEVLTNPLPLRQTPLIAATEEEDEDTNAFYELTDTSPNTQPLASAAPNSTTLHFMIQHLARLNQVSLVRHYLLDAIQLERDAHIRLVKDLLSRPLAEATTPRVSVRKETLLAAVGLANKRNNQSFYHWILREVRSLVRSKNARLSFFYGLQRQRAAGIVLNSIITHRMATSPETILSGASIQSDPFISTAEPSTLDRAGTEPAEPPVWMPLPGLSIPFFTPSSPRGEARPHPTTYCEPAAVVHAAATAPPSSPPFDLDTHVRLLKRDTDETARLLDRLRARAWRLVQRQKERLGRRVWAGRDVFLRSAGHRVELAREHWVEQVGFREPWKTGNRLSGVKGPRKDLSWARRFTLPHAERYEVVEKRFLQPDTGVRIARPRWR